MDPVVEERVKGLTEKEKMDLIEKWLLEALEESRSGEVKINVGKGWFRINRNGEWWAHSDGSCYPNPGYEDWDESYE